MNYNLTQEQKMIIEEIKSFAFANLNKKECYTSFSREMWRATAELGLFGLCVPEEYGGLGESYLLAAHAMENLGYACHNNGFIFAITNHMWVAINLILLYGTEEQKNKYLPIMISGEKIGAMAISEANAGSDATGMLTTAKLDNGSYVINGSKMFVSNGTIADIFIVFATFMHNNIRRITPFIVERDQEGVIIGADIKKMGLESCPMAEITFDNCRISEKNIIASPLAGDAIMKNALEWERCYEFASHIGTMKRIMEMSIKHMAERKQFGKSLSEYQALTHKVADMKVRIEMARRMLYDIAVYKDQKKSAYLEASIFKLYTSEAYINTCRDAMQIFGAYGYTKEYELEREMRDALACSVYSGTNEIQRNTIYTLTSMEELML